MMLNEVLPDTREGPSNSRTLYAGNLFFLAVISLALFKVLMQLHVGNFDDLAEATYGVLEGKPHWIAYQNRLLGPYSVYLISKLGFTYAQAMKIFILAALFIQSVLLFHLTRKMKLNERESLACVMLYSFLLILVHDRWFYTWDCVDAIVFTLFAWGIVNRRETVFFATLFFVALANRESALFIALYLMLDAFSFSSITRFTLTSLNKLLTGAALLAVGAVYTKCIRDFLFISRHTGEPDTGHELLGNHLCLFENLGKLFFDNLHSTDIVNSVFILAPLLYLSRFVRTYSDAQIKALLMYFALVASFLVFGWINETRLYIVLIPFFIFLYISKTGLPVPDPADEQAARTTLCPSFRFPVFALHRNRKAVPRRRKG